MNEKYFPGDLVNILWTKIKVELAKKANLAELEDYVTSDSFATLLATELANYVTKTEFNTAMSSAITREIVSELPSESEAKSNVIYMVPSETTDDKNARDEYMFTDRWELIGTTKVDLSGYWAKSELRAMTEAELNAILV